MEKDPKIAQLEVNREDDDDEFKTSFPTILFSLLTGSHTKTAELPEFYDESAQLKRQEYIYTFFPLSYLKYLDDSLIFPKTSSSKCNENRHRHVYQTIDYNHASLTAR